MFVWLVCHSVPASEKEPVPLFFCSPVFETVSPLSGKPLRLTARDDPSVGADLCAVPFCLPHLSASAACPHKTKEAPKNASFVARLKGLEPLTYWFVASHSIQLSYRRISGCSNAKLMLAH